VKSSRLPHSVGKADRANPSGRAMIEKDTANAVFFSIISGLPKDYEPDKVAQQRRVRQQVDFGSETHQNRYGCPATGT